eukprot:TRINITY_DN12404_c0_g1_i10.p1 TRINITY_DN12404_c0_g1~~TRINITY_DN12404_c0_g1_i10.p1  ORF type:complete len:149 (+),score=26.10 TRINITY_DN12404_c0_g1_i10:78-524(+)
MGYVCFQENSLMNGNSPVLNQQKDFHAQTRTFAQCFSHFMILSGSTSSSLANELSRLFDPTPGPLWVSVAVEFDTFFRNSNFAIRAVCNLNIFLWAPDPFLSSMPSATYACWDIFLFSAIQRFLFKSAGLAFSMTLALLISDVALGSG